MNDIVDKRTSPRLTHIAPIAVFWPTGERRELKLHDFSDGGLFIECSDADMPKQGMQLKVQSLELDVAPVLPVMVMRIIPGQGFGARFVAEDET
ncbi:MAG: PilZ domain-containing protein [Methylococcales bacterium]|nr:PilZ domain-containing protein [Methylococcales bacterium]